jgi:hypothetical protein
MFKGRQREKEEEEESAAQQLSTATATNIAIFGRHPLSQAFQRSLGKDRESV